MLLSSPVLLSALFMVGGVEPGRPIAGTDWAIAPGGPRSYLERVAGRPIDPRDVPPIREGDLVFDAEGMSLDMLTALDIPIAALDHDPTPGVLYVAMDGVTLTKSCGSAQSANAALDCSPLVDGTVTFPPFAAGNPQLKAAEFQRLQEFYADYNLVLTSNRPPEWLPYTMAVIGGNAQQVGAEFGVCGIANVACDGAKRNHVSLSFPESCPGSVAEIAAQESAHNWGLEHTDLNSDLMYPIIEGASEFRDECMGISDLTGNGQTKCTYVHELYCPAGGGEQQNSHTELLGVFGPRVADTTKPTISASPASGSQVTSDDTVAITATISDDSNFIGVHWTWLEGLPDSLPDGYRRCTNDVCDDTYGAWKPQSEPYDFLTLKQPPPGQYKFQVEAMDAYGNHASQVIELTVVPAEGGTTGEPPIPGESDSDTDTPTSGPDETGDVPTSDGMGDPSVPDGGGESSGGEGTAGTTEDGGCRLNGSPGPLTLLLLLGVGARRRRRA